MTQLVLRKDMRAALNIRSDRTLNKYISQGVVPKPVRFGKRDVWEANDIETAKRNVLEQGHG